MYSLVSLLLCHLVASVDAASSKLQSCPLLGQQFPAPVQLSKESKFQTFADGLEAQLKKSANTSPYDETTFSIGIFSTSEDNLVYQHNHASAYLSKPKNDSYGARNVNADSIYRIGSISKLLTIYLWLITEGDKRFNDPITDYVPQLRNVRGNWNSLTPEWDEITVGDLAGEMGGLARDFGLTDIASPQSATFQLPKSLLRGFPKLPMNEVPECSYIAANGSFIDCSEAQYVQGIATESPIFPTAFTPAYSNEAFALLGIALAKIADKPLEAIFKDSMVKPLGLEGTFYTVPSSITDQDVIPGTPLAAGWSTDFGVFGPAGGYYSSTNDFARIGKAILDSTLISKSQTRRWLKPTSFLEAFDQSVGRPWEIYRYKANGQSIDVYTKSGGFSVYHTYFALIPTYNVGISILTAQDSTSVASPDVRELLTIPLLESLLPVLDEISQSQAATNFAGHYISSTSNSSLTVEAHSSGLQVTKWISKGANILEGLFAAVVPDLIYLIVPNQLYTGSKVGFTSVYQSAVPPMASSILYATCSAWFYVDELTYGNIPLGQMVFDVDEKGKATSVEIRALRETLTKTS